MRKKPSFLIFPFLLMGIFLVLLSSCKDDDNNETPTNSSVCLLSGFEIEYKTVCDYGSNTENVNYNLLFDSQNRIIKWSYSSSDYYDFIYGSNGKIERIIDRGKDYLLFSWDGNEVISEWYDDYNEPEGKRRVFKVNSNNEIISGDFFILSDSIWEKVQYAVYTWNNGNLTKIDIYKSNNKDFSNEKNINFFEESKIFFSNKPTFEQKNTNSQSSIVDDFYLDISYIFTYTNIKNPYKQLNAISFLEFTEPIFHSKNCVKIVSEFEDNITYVLSDYNWFPNQNNFPFKMVSSNESGSCVSTETLLIKYSNCQ